MNRLLVIGVLITSFCALDSAASAGERKGKGSLGSKDPNLVHVRSQIDGLILYVGAEAKKGEKAEGVVVAKQGKEEVAYIPLKIGDKVKVGQVLARLDDREARAVVAISKAKLDNAKADYLAAQAAEDEAHARLKRAAELVAKDAITRDEYMAAEFTAKRFSQEALVKKTHIAIAEAEAQLARLRLENHQITSPFAGMVEAIERTSGEAAKQSDTIVVIRQHRAK